MSFNRRSFVNHPDVFCYVCGCGEYTFKENWKTENVSVKRSYLGYFGIRLGDKDETLVLHQICITCIEHLQQWSDRKRNSLKVNIPMVCREPKNHVDDIYFCLIKITGINRNNRNKWPYPE